MILGGLGKLKGTPRLIFIKKKKKKEKKRDTKNLALPDTLYLH
jgi:hypothetical protein